MIYYIALDMQARYPGAHASTDSTFRAASRTQLSTATFKNEDREMDAGAIALILGEDHSVGWWGALPSESWTNLTPGLIKYGERLSKIQVEQPYREGVSLFSCRLSTNKDVTRPQWKC